MFKKIINNFIERLDKIKDEMLVIRDNSFYSKENIRNLIKAVDEVKQSVRWCNPESAHARTIEEQQNIIRMLTEALTEKYKHGLFICSKNGEYPLVIRDGKELVDDLTSSFSITWNYDECPNIEIVQATNGYED